MKEGNGERFLKPETSTWTPPLKDEELKTYRQVEAKLEQEGKVQKLLQLQDRLKRAGKKTAGAELEIFIAENHITFEIDHGPAAEQTAERLVQDTLRETETAPPAASEPAAEEDQTAKDAAAQAEQEARKIAEERKTAAKWFSEQVSDLGNELAEKGIPREKLAAAGLFDMKTRISKDIRALEDLGAVRMSAADLAAKRNSMQDLLAEMARITSGAFGAELQKTANRRWNRSSLAAPQPEAPEPAPPEASPES